MTRLVIQRRLACARSVQVEYDQLFILKLPGRTNYRQPIGQERTAAFSPSGAHTTDGRGTSRSPLTRNHQRENMKMAPPRSAVAMHSLPVRPGSGSPQSLLFPSALCLFPVIFFFSCVAIIYNWQTGCLISMACAMASVLGLQKTCAGDRRQ